MEKDLKDKKPAENGTPQSTLAEADPCSCCNCGTCIFRYKSSRAPMQIRNLSRKQIHRVMVLLLNWKNISVMRRLLIQQTTTVQQQKRAVRQRKAHPRKVRKKQQQKKAQEKEPYQNLPEITPVRPDRDPPRLL